MTNEESLKKLINEEINAAEERLRVARILLNKSKYPDAVNRIYYSVFNATKAVLHSIGKDVKTHSGLMAEFGLHIIKEKKMDSKFGQILRQTMEARESSDYKITAIFDKDEVKEMYDDAKDFLEEAKKFVKTSAYK